MEDDCMVDENMSKGCLYVVLINFYWLSHENLECIDYRSSTTLIQHIMNLYPRISLRKHKLYILGFITLFLQGISNLTPLNLMQFMLLLWEYFPKDRWNETIKFMRPFHDPWIIFSIFIQQIFIKLLGWKKESTKDRF